MDWDKIKKAVEAIQAGIGKRVDIGGGIIVYSVGEKVIRIDIKK